MPSESTPAQSARRIRLWPVWCILLLAGIALLTLRAWPSLSYQQKNLYSVPILAAGALLLLLWVLFFSRLAWSKRFAIVGSVVVLGVLVASSFRIRGVSGDLLPVFEWRFRGQKTAPTAGAQLSGKLNHAPVLPLEDTSQIDYSQFLGPWRNGQVRGPTLDTDWKKRPPKLLWKRPMGAAWSGFAVRGAVAVTQEQNGEDEVVNCYAVRTGELLWAHRDPAHYKTTIAGEGPRATPTIALNRVFTFGATGILNCFDLTTGQLVWMRDVLKDHQGKAGEWGVSCSPLVANGRVIVTTCGDKNHSLAAYDIDHGELVWSNGADDSSYSSPSLETLGAVAQILAFNAHSVSGHDPATGAPLWKHPWPAGHPHITTPLFYTNDQILVSSGYGTGSELLKIEKSSSNNWNVRRVWKSNRLKSKFSNVVLYHGNFFGLDDGVLVCLEAASGKLKWKEGRYGHGQVILTGGVLLIMAENGDVVLVEAAAEQPRELSRFHALDGKTWNPPALAGRHLLVRNDQEAACYMLPVDQPSP